MIEVLLVVGVIAIVGAAGWLVASWPWAQVLWLGGALVAAGLLLGVAFGSVYHLRLHRGLSRSGQGVPKGWWWSPTRYHDRLSPADYQRMVPWFVAGAASVGVALLGCAVTGLALLRVR